MVHVEFKLVYSKFIIFDAELTMVHQKFVLVDIKCILADTKINFGQ
jgi:hypothetical protein